MWYTKFIAPCQSCECFVAKRVFMKGEGIKREVSLFCLEEVYKLLWLRAKIISTLSPLTMTQINI